MKRIYTAKVLLCWLSIRARPALAADHSAEVDRYLEKVVQSYDPALVWDSVDSVLVRGSVDGLFFEVRGKGGILTDFVAEVFTKEQKVVFRDFPKAGATGTFFRDLVTICDPTGHVTAVMDARKRLEEKDAADPFTSWDYPDVLDFFGYALWNRVNFSYHLRNPALQIDVLDRKNGEPTALEVTYPKGYPTHSRAQQYYFDASSHLLARHRYAVEIISPDVGGRASPVEIRADSGRRRVREQSARLAAPVRHSGVHSAALRPVGPRCLLGGSIP